MAIERSREELADIFRNRARPDENDFQDLFESFINKVNDQVRVGVNKNIGIGVTGGVDPAAKLHVQGDLKLHFGEIVKNISKNNELLTSEDILGEPEAQTSDVSIPTQAAVKTYVDHAVDPIEGNVMSKVNELIVGCVLPFACEEDKIPEGWLLCDGQMLDKSEYPLLFSKIDKKYGDDGDPASNFFCVPNLVDRFIRGGDNINFGVLQDDALQDHSHPATNAPDNTGPQSSTHRHYLQNNFFFTEVKPDDYEPAWDDPSAYREQTSRIKFGQLTGSADHGGFGFGLTYIGDNIGTSAGDSYEARKVYDLRTKSGGNHTHPYTSDVAVGEINYMTNPHVYRYADETRPKNISLIYCIKY